MLTGTIREMASHCGVLGTSKTKKPYCSLIREDFKIIDKKAKEEIQKAYTKGFTPDYIMEKNNSQPKFEMENNILVFKP